MNGPRRAFSIRLATPADAATIVAHRRAMFQDMGITDRAALDAMDERFAEWLTGSLARGEYRGWFLTDAASAVVAGAGLWLQDNPATPRDQSPRRGYVMNVYTCSDYRRQGLARRLMDALLDWCRDQGIRTVVLHSSDAARTLYESIGFHQTDEMRMLLSPK